MDPTTYKALKNLNGSISENIRNAIDNYLQGETQKIYNVDTISILNEQIEDLKQQRNKKDEIIMIKDNQISYLNMSWWGKRKYNLLGPKK